MEFILHIGHGKCGSTSIQRAMYAKRAALREQGLIYETAAPNGSHFGLATLIGRNTRGNLSQQTALAKKTIQMIRKASSGGEHVVLSGENFFFLHRAAMTKILEHITDSVGGLNAVAYVRSPHSMYLSWVQQVLKGSSTFLAPDAYHYRIDDALQKWHDWDHVRKLVVRNFDRNHLYQSDVVQDFSRILNDLSGKNVTLQAVETNTSLSAEQMVALQRFRAQVLPEHNGKLRPESAQLIAFFEKMNRIALIGRKPALVPSALAAVCAGNTDVVDNVNAMYPNLRLRMPEIPADQPGDACWRTSQDVADILDGVELGDVDRIMALIPQLSPELAGGMTLNARAALERFLSTDSDQRAKQIAHVMQFWQGLNCDQACHDLQMVLS